MISKNLSVLSSEIKDIKHMFFVHALSSEISFTYNRIRRFITANPLIVVIAFFCEDLKTGKHRDHDIVRNLSKFLKEKSRISSNLKK